MKWRPHDEIGGVARYWYDALPAQAEPAPPVTVASEGIMVNRVFTQSPRFSGIIPACKEEGYFPLLVWDIIRRRDRLARRYWFEAR